MGGAAIFGGWSLKRAQSGAFLFECAPAAAMCWLFDSSAQIDEVKQFHL
jgi:hypothetical protein